MPSRLSGLFQRRPRVSAATRGRLTRGVMQRRRSPSAGARVRATGATSLLSGTTGQLSRVASGSAREPTRGFRCRSGRSPPSSLRDRQYRRQHRQRALGGHRQVVHAACCRRSRPRAFGAVARSHHRLRSAVPTVAGVGAEAGTLMPMRFLQQRIGGDRRRRRHPQSMVRTAASTGSARRSRSIQRIEDDIRSGVNASARTTRPRQQQLRPSLRAQISPRPAPKAVAAPLALDLVDIKPRAGFQHLPTTALTATPVAKRSGQQPDSGQRDRPTPQPAPAAPGPAAPPRPRIRPRTCGTRLRARLSAGPAPSRPNRRRAPRRATVPTTALPTTSSATRRPDSGHRQRRQQAGARSDAFGQTAIRPATRSPADASSTARTAASVPCREVGATRRAECRRPRAANRQRCR